MGDTLLKYYEYALQRGGSTLQMRLVVRTGVTPADARHAADMPEAARKLHNALRELLNDPNVPRF
jgi:hypothetical protein